MPDEPKWFQPGYQHKAPRPPSELIWSLRKDHETLTCELRLHGRDLGVEVQVFRNGEFHSGQRFEMRAQALHYATVLRGDFERLGWRRASDGEAGPEATGP